MMIILRLFCTTPSTMLRRKGELSQSNLMFSAMEQKLQDFAFLAQWKCDLSDLQI